MEASRSAPKGNEMLTANGLLQYANTAYRGISIAAMQPSNVLHYPYVAVNVHPTLSYMEPHTQYNNDNVFQASNIASSQSPNAPFSDSTSMMPTGGSTVASYANQANYSAGINLSNQMLPGIAPSHANLLMNVPGNHDFALSNGILTSLKTRVSPEQEANMNRLPGHAHVGRSVGHKLFVGQIPIDCTEADLSSIFELFGSLLEVKVMRKPNGRSKGSAWVRYEKMESAQSAINNINQQFIMAPHNHPIRVQFATDSTTGGGNHYRQSIGSFGNGSIQANRRSQLQLPVHGPVQFIDSSASCHQQDLFSSQPNNRRIAKVNVAASTNARAVQMRLIPLHLYQLLQHPSAALTNMNSRAELDSSVQHQSSLSQPQQGALLGEVPGIHPLTIAAVNECNRGFVNDGMMSNTFCGSSGNIQFYTTPMPAHQSNMQQ